MGEAQTSDLSRLTSDISGLSAESVTGQMRDRIEKMTRKPGIE